MANERSRDQLIEEMEADGDDYFSAGRLNNLIDLSLSALRVVGSLVATVLAGSVYHTTAPVAK